MAAKQLQFDEAARHALLRGVEKLAQRREGDPRASGRNVILDKKFGSPTITKDGVTVAKEIELEDPYENMGAQLVREVASKTSDIAGDGTTTATVLAEAIYREGLQERDRRREPDLAPARHQQGRRSDRRRTRAASPRRSRTAPKSRRSPPSPPTGTPPIGEIIADAMDKVGKDGTITVEEAKSIETTLDVVEGMQFDKGYLSPYFVTNAESMEAILENAYILIHEKKISSLKDLLPRPREGGEGRPAAAHHRGRRGRRSPRDPRGEQAARHPASRRRQGARLRRSPQGHDGRHRRPHRRPLHHRRPRHQAREHHAGRPRQGQARHHRQGKHHHRRRRRQSKPTSRAASARSAARSRRPPAITTARSSRSASRSSPAAWPSSMSAPRPRPR